MFNFRRWILFRESGDIKSTVASMGATVDLQPNGTGVITTSRGNLKEVLLAIKQQGWVVSRILDDASAAIYPEKRVDKMPPIVYHITPSRNLDAILRTGIRPGKNTGDSYGEHVSGRIFLTSNKEFIPKWVKMLSMQKSAMDPNAGAVMYEPWAVIPIDTKGLNQAYVDFNDDEGAMFTTQPIPAQSILQNQIYSVTPQTSMGRKQAPSGDLADPTEVEDFKAKLLDIFMSKGQSRGQAEEEVQGVMGMVGRLKRKDIPAILKQMAD